MNTPKNKRLYVKEELIALTGNYVEALILDQFLAEAATGGWVEKRAETLHEELMLEGTMTPRTAARYVRNLVDKGYLQRRPDPEQKWDRTWQYRPDRSKVNADLQAIGYELQA